MMSFQDTPTNIFRTSKETRLFTPTANYHNFERVISEFANIITY